MVKKGSILGMIVMLCWAVDVAAGDHVFHNLRVVVDPEAHTLRVTDEVEFTSKLSMTKTACEWVAISVRNNPTKTCSARLRCLGSIRNFSVN